MALAFINKKTIDFVRAYMDKEVNTDCIKRIVRIYLYQYKSKINVLFDFCIKKAKANPSL
jgi:hypothetical protein